MSANDYSDLIVKLVQQTIDAPSWREAGGSTGSITSFAGLLIITQTPDNHRAIGNLLTQLRQELNR